MADLDEQILEDLYTWIDQIPLSRPKRDVKRDFSDGVLIAEVVKHFLPQYVELHNYSSALAFSKKVVNWHILNRKVFKRLGFEVNEDVIKNIANCQPFAIEQFLLLLRRKIEHVSSSKHDERKTEHNDFTTSRLPSPKKAASVQPPIIAHRTSASTSKSSSNIVASNSGDIMPSNLKELDFGGNRASSEKQTLLLLEEKEEQLKAKDETIEILQAKIHRLEQLLQLKDIRIEDLQTRLDQGQNEVKAPNPTTRNRPLHKGLSKC